MGEFDMMVFNGFFTKKGEQVFSKALQIAVDASKSTRWDLPKLLKHFIFSYTSLSCLISYQFKRKMKKLAVRINQKVRKDSS